MRAVLQKITNGTISVEGKIVADIKYGLLVYLGIGVGDGPADIEYTAEKVATVRIFPDSEGKMNLSIADITKEICVVSQFTLYGDARKGRRPSYDKAEKPERAKTLYEAFCEYLRNRGFIVKQGVFQAHMAVSYVNDGPVTLLLDSSKIV